MLYEVITIVWNALDQSKISGVFYEFDDIRFAKVATEGSYLLFDDWKNKGVILFGGKKLIISNINFNVKSEEFMSRITSYNVCYTKLLRPRAPARRSARAGLAGPGIAV